LGLVLRLVRFGLCLPLVLAVHCGLDSFSLNLVESVAHGSGERLGLSVAHY
jgi:hypothetical protein